MGTGIVTKLLISLLLKCLTETFIAKVIIASLQAWSKGTENKLDDKVVAAMAESLGVPVEKLKDAE